MTKRRMVLVYCLGILAASWALQLAGMYSVHSKVENNAITPWLVVAMMTRALGVLILMAFYTTALGLLSSIAARLAGATFWWLFAGALLGQRKTVHTVRDPAHK